MGDEPQMLDADLQAQIGVRATHRAYAPSSVDTRHKPSRVKLDCSLLR